VIALGHIKAIIQPTSVLVFDSHLQGVSDWLDDLSTFMQGHENAFELEVLESALRDVTERCQRRVCIYRPLVETLLAGGEDLEAAESGLHRVVILKDSLSSFELEVNDLVTLLSELINNDEDMLDIMITERSEAERKGAALDATLHSNVELLLENYHRQLALCLHDIVAMQRQVQAKQEFMAISLDVYRNRMHRMNVQLGIGGISLGVCTSIAGYFGMNVAIPSFFENAPMAFWGITAFSCALAALVHTVCSYYLSGKAMRRGAEMRLREIHALQSIFRDMSRVDFALRSAANLPELSKSGFRRALESSSPNQQVSDLEVDLLFDSLDTSKDGVLQDSEIKLMYEGTLRAGKRRR